MQTWDFGPLCFAGDGEVAGLAYLERLGARDVSRLATGADEPDTGPPTAWIPRPVLDVAAGRCPPQGLSSG
ncbi:hypothetical protein FAGKG844_640020 [Frankia sp. AgKG'84/4]